MSKVPLCFKFCPTEKELVEKYLIPKAKGLALPDGHEIVDKALYGVDAAPWKVFNNEDPWQYVDDTMKKKIIYVFTKVIAKKELINNYMVRTTGYGTWQVQSYTDGGSSIAYKRLFVFKPKKEFENKTRGKWTMYEYKLKNTDGCKDGDFVVCRITCQVEKEGSDDRSGSSSDAASNSVQKTRVLTMSEVPLCFRFCPTERELVEFYLIPKANGLALPDGHQILEKSLYGEEAAPPWEVFNNQDPWQYVDGTMNKKIIYVFTKVSVNNRKVRVAGCGKWREAGAAKPVRGSGIADKRVFTFKPKKKFENETRGKWRGKWTMHEYMLKKTDDCKDGNFVVCRISYQVEKEGSGSEDDGSGSSYDAASNSVEKTSKKKEQGNKRVRREGVSTDQMGNQKSGQVSTEMRLSNQEIDFPCRGLSQQDENQEVVPHPAAIDSNFFTIYSSEGVY